MSYTRFKVNLNSAVAWMTRSSLLELLEIGKISDLLFRKQKLAFSSIRNT